MLFFVQKHSSCYVHLVAGLIFLAVPEGLVQRHLSFPRCSICVQLRTFPGLVHPALATLISLFFPTTCPASPEAHASLSAHTTAFAGAPACVARAVPTHCQESPCGLFLPVPTALLEELGTVYHIPSGQGDPGHVGDLVLAMSLSWTKQPWAGHWAQHIPHSPQGTSSPSVPFYYYFWS